MMTGLLSNSAVRQALAQANKAPDSHAVIIVALDHRQRTNAQNIHFMRVCRAFSQQLGGSVTDWRKALAIRFLGYASVTTPDGDQRDVPASTSDLSVSEFTAFLSACLVFAADNQVTIPPPTPKSATPADCHKM